MNTNHSTSRACRLTGILTTLVSVLLTALPARAQLTPAEINQIRSAMGNRIEAITILGGDFGMSGATFNRGSDKEINVSKFGGAGDIGDPKPLGNLGIGWQPRLQGSMGYLSAKNDITSGDLAGTTSKFHGYSIEFGGGARFWFNDFFSIAPTFMGMYGYTENTFYPRNNATAQSIHAQAQQEGLVDWNADTWTVRPALNLQYVYTWRRTIFTLSSDGTYFHTESFSTSNPNVDVNGDSETWMNKIDVDIPLGRQLFGHELRTGGYFSRTEFYDGIQSGLRTDHLYEIHGRVVLDFLNQLWKVQWIGLGGSYLWGNNNLSGWSVGADIAFRF